MFRNINSMNKGNSISHNIHSICMPFAVVLILIAVFGCSDSLKEVGSNTSVDNSLLLGIWVIHFEDDTLAYFVTQEGGVYDNSFTGFTEDTTEGTYQSFSDGTFSMTINPSDTDIRLSGKLTSTTDGEITYSSGAVVKKGVMKTQKAALLEGTWKGTLTENGSSDSYPVIFSVDPNSIIVQYNDTTLPMSSGRMTYSFETASEEAPDNFSAKAVAYVKIDKSLENGDSVPYDEVSFSGDYSDNTISGIFHTFGYNTTGTAVFERLVKSDYKENCESLTATIITSMGTIKVELYVNERPETVWNFVNLAEGRQETIKDDSPYYDGLIFHRVANEYGEENEEYIYGIIQGGCPYGNGSGNPGYKFEDEFDPSLDHGYDIEGVLAMANSGANTNGSQFFITRDAIDSELGWEGSYTIFGKVTSGMDVVNAIGSVETENDRPVEDVVIESITVDHSQCDSGS